MPSERKRSDAIRKAGRFLGWETGIENAPKLEYNNLQSVGTL